MSAVPPTPPGGFVLPPVATQGFVQDVALTTARALSRKSGSVSEHAPARRAPAPAVVSEDGEVDWDPAEVGYRRTQPRTGVVAAPRAPQVVPPAAAHRPPSTGTLTLGQLWAAQRQQESADGDAEGFELEARTARSTTPRPAKPVRSAPASGASLAAAALARMKPR